MTTEERSRYLEQIDQAIAEFMQDVAMRLANEGCRGKAEVQLNLSVRINGEAILGTLSDGQVSAPVASPAGTTENDIVFLRQLGIRE
jgi:hypothetical protein